jgi:hypothetical protein
VRMGMGRRDEELYVGAIRDKKKKKKKKKKRRGAICWSRERAFCLILKHPIHAILNKRREREMGQQENKRREREMGPRRDPPRTNAAREPRRDPLRL